MTGKLCYLISPLPLRQKSSTHQTMERISKWQIHTPETPSGSIKDGARANILGHNPSHKHAP